MGKDRTSEGGQVVFDELVREVKKLEHDLIKIVGKESG